MSNLQVLFNPLLTHKLLTHAGLGEAPQESLTKRDYKTFLPVPTAITFRNLLSVLCSSLLNILYILISTGLRIGQAYFYCVILVLHMDKLLK